MCIQQDGTWAGQQEQVALARCLGMVLCIYQAGQPCWNIRPDSPDFPKVTPSVFSGAVQNADSGLHISKWYMHCICWADTTVAQPDADTKLGAQLFDVLNASFLTSS